MGSYTAWKLSSESDFTSFRYFSEVPRARTWAVTDAAQTQMPGKGLLEFRLPGTTVVVQERPDCIQLAMLSVPTKKLVLMILHPASNLATVLLISGCILVNRRGRGRSRNQPPSKIWKISCRPRGLIWKKQ